MNEIDKKIENLIDQQLLDEKSINFSDQNDQQQLDFELQLQKKIDDSLSRLFPIEPTQEAAHRKKMEFLISDSKSDSKSKSKLPERRRMAVRVCVLAASLMLLATMVFWQNGKDDQVAVFKRQPLVLTMSVMSQHDSRKNSGADSASRYGLARCPNTKRWSALLFPVVFRARQQRCSVKSMMNLYWYSSTTSAKTMNRCDRKLENKRAKMVNTMSPEQRKMDWFTMRYLASKVLN